MEHLFDEALELGPRLESGRPPADEVLDPAAR
jgi:hypothetical protein